MNEINETQRVKVLIFGVGQCIPIWVLNKAIQQLPDDAELLHATFINRECCCGLLFRSSEFEALKLGEMAPRVTIEVNITTKEVTLHGLR